MNIFNKKNTLLALLMLGGSHVLAMDLYEFYRDVVEEEEISNKKEEQQNTIVENVDVFKKEETNIKEINNEKKEFKCTIEDSEKTLLEKAIDEGMFTTVDILIENGANIEQINSNGHTPMYYALYNMKAIGFIRAYPNVIFTLLFYNACITLHKKGEPTPLEMIIGKFAYEINDVVKKFIKKGADVNEPGVCKKLPLTLAINKKYAKTVKLLLKNDAKAHLTIDGKSPFNFAIELLKENPTCEKAKEIITLIKNHHNVYITHEKNFHTFNTLHDLNIQYNNN